MAGHARRILGFLVVAATVGAGGGGAVAAADVRSGAQVSTPDQVATVATTAANAADPGFYGSQDGPQQYPPADGEDGTPGGVTFDRTTDVDIKPLAAGGSHVRAGASSVWLVGPNSGLPVKAANGSTDVVMGSGPAHTVVQRDENELRSMVVITDSSAPTDYTYSLTGGSFTAEPDGWIVARDAAGEAVGVVNALWGRDANGASVPVSYAVKSGVLVLTVEHAGAAYPVVADPRISFGWYVYVRFSRSEVQSMYFQIYQAGLAVFQAACRNIPAAWVRAACMAGVRAYVGSVANTIRYARDHNRCIEFRINYAPALLVGWRSYSC